MTAELARRPAWIVPWNARTYDADAAFAARSEVDWSETAARIERGDTIYLYGSRPHSSLTHVCEVVATGIPQNPSLNDAQFWTDPDEFLQRASGTSMRLRLIRTLTDEERAALDLRALRAHGLTSAPQGRVRVPEKLAVLLNDLMIPDRASTGDAAAELLPWEAPEVEAFSREILSGR